MHIQAWLSKSTLLGDPRLQSACHMDIVFLGAGIRGWKSHPGIKEHELQLHKEKIRGENRKQGRKNKRGRRNEASIQASEEVGRNKGRNCAYHCLRVVTAAAAGTINTVGPLVFHFSLKPLFLVTTFTELALAIAISRLILNFFLKPVRTAQYLHLPLSAFTSSLCQCCCWPESSPSLSLLLQAGEKRFGQSADSSSRWMWSWKRARLKLKFDCSLA